MPDPINLFRETVTGKGVYLVGYLIDGWTRELVIEASCPGEAEMITQNIVGNICGVTYVERN